jgi:stress-induced morphogen
MTKAELTEALLRAFPEGEVEVTDLTGTSDHYQARIVSEAFQGKSRLEQHRMVYAALGDAMKGAVHALALQTSARDKR